MMIQISRKEKIFFLVVIILIFIGCLIYFTLKETLEIKDFITILALLLGPVVAVLITRYNDQNRVKKDRQLSTFRLLMQNRSDPLSKDFVAALNLIEIDFNEYPLVKNAWKTLFDALSQKTKPTTPDENSALFLLWQTLTTKLLYELGKCLNIEIEQVDIMHRVYTPQAWVEEKNRTNEIFIMIHNL